MEMGTPEIPAACHARIAKRQGTSWVDSKWSRNSSTEVTASWRKVDEIWIFFGVNESCLSPFPVMDQG